MISDYWFKKIGKMIESEDNDGFYQINERYTATLLDLGFIEETRWTELAAGWLCSCFDYVVTKKGRKAYKEWKK